MEEVSNHTAMKLLTTWHNKEHFNETRLNQRYSYHIYYHPNISRKRKTIIWESIPEKTSATK